ncbi:MAG TPA: succinylglutamate desuccinylase/aspartoacylase family protein [Thermomicrobiaceae bacterium]|nr:succinylglutamate desuccinylase/aspartoacylase family protein [Thermomicrobiaceae bacterium]
METEWVTLGAMASGAPLRLPIHTIRGSRPGPVVGLSAGIHGDEIAPVEVVRKVVSLIDPAAMHGTLRVMPVANPLAFEGATRHTPHDMLNLNRVFPGDPAGWITEQLAAAIVDRFLPGLDALIDLHAGGIFPTVDYVYILNDEALSRSLNFNVLYRAGRSFAGTLGTVAIDLGISTVVVEAGGGVDQEDIYVGKAAMGVFRALSYLGLHTPNPLPPVIPTVVDELLTIRPRQGGLFVPEKRIGDLGRIVPRGTLLGRVYDPYGFGELERFEAPFERTVLILLRGGVGRVIPGDYAYMLGKPEGE